ncbi:hypothetical protein PMG71_00020 [Roseofilum sp. BLCC_M154]|uniref:Uncharacterized protein n=1 Tax=Roseofilum acuticapitatum BLCC-M154 TaxID=3022444 RepID=A0ABT7ALN5_9CYAN|nr:hypothetical protein [Roseofilum acuticapitatum]MDJ1167807.1 hypothetical protein [Roseofilum acuticapitatum BLCC-M154]
MLSLPSALPQISNEIERHPEALRMKKMLVCAWQDIWENDAKRLRAIALSALLESVINKYPTLEDLSEALQRIANTLNKRQEYQAIANSIILIVGKVYPDTEEATQVYAAPPTHITLASHQPPPSSNTVVDPPVNYQIRTGYDSFNLRLELMRYTNPLRAKILLFSALHQKSRLEEQDWVKLKAENLDSLLYTIYEQCETLEKLTTCLCSTANNAEDEPSECNQAAGAIIQCMGRFYQDWEPGMEDAVHQANAYRNPGELTGVILENTPDSYSSSGEQESTRRILPS